MLTVGDQFPRFNLTANVGREKGKEFKNVTTGRAYQSVEGKGLLST